jgi:hypothetical protein
MFRYVAAGGTGGMVMSRRVMAPTSNKMSRACDADSDNPTVRLYLLVKCRPTTPAPPPLPLR